MILVLTNISRGMVGEIIFPKFPSYKTLGVGSKTGGIVMTVDGFKILF